MLIKYNTQYFILVLGRYFMSNCLFCKIIKGEIPATKVYENDQLIAIEDVSPQAPTHLLVIPKKHIATTLELASEDRQLIGEIYLRCNKLAEERKIDRSGYRIVNNCQEGAGQTVFHLHFHLLGGRNMTWPPG